MDKRIILLLIAIVVLLVMLQNEVSVWAYIITIFLVMVLWSVFD